MVSLYFYVFIKRDGLINGDHAAFTRSTIVVSRDVSHPWGLALTLRIGGPNAFAIKTKVAHRLCVT